MKRAASTTTVAAVKAMRNVALGDLQPPSYAPLRDGDEPFFRGVVRARPRDEWTEADLVNAVKLARCQRDYVDQSALLDSEGMVVEHPRNGTPVKNPRADIVDQLARRELALIRSLRMGGRIRGDARDDAHKRVLEDKAREFMRVANDDLLA